MGEPEKPDDVSAASEADRLKALEAQMHAKFEEARRGMEAVDAAPHAGSVNGSGSMLLDVRLRDDGLYDAVRWWTFAYMPLVPRKLVVFRPVSFEPEIVRERYRMSVLRELSPPLSRVLFAYAVGWGTFVPMVLAFVRMDQVSASVGRKPGMAVTVGAVALCVWGMWRLANLRRTFDNLGGPRR